MSTSLGLEIAVNRFFPATLCLLVAVMAQAQSGRLVGMDALPEDGTPRLLGADEVDCSRILDAGARQSCEDAQGKPAPPVETISAEDRALLAARMTPQARQAAAPKNLQDPIVCERFSPQESDHFTIAARDGSQEVVDGNAYLYFRVSKDDDLVELPEVFVGDTLPKTFAARMSDGSTKYLGDGKWLEEATRVQSGESYRVRLTIQSPGTTSIAESLACLTP